MKKIIFCQFSNQLLNQDYSKSIADDYYSLIYKTKESQGYYRNDHFFEIPLWIAEVSGLLNPRDYDRQLLIITDVNEAIEKLNSLEADYILFSVLDVTVNVTEKVIKGYTGKAEVILGGYNAMSKFSSVRSFADYLGIKYKYSLDYSLFKGYKTIPRLTLSTGCLNHCKFCTVENELRLKSLTDIISQVQSFKPLKFKLIYLNDKTFFQADNYSCLGRIFRIIRAYNPDFQGFIIQTTVNKIIESKYYMQLRYLHIKIVELGIETFNNSILHSLKKPQDERMILKAFNILSNLNIKIIPNIIIGLMGENKASYNKTLFLLEIYQDKIFSLNIYNLAVYFEAELSREIKIKDNSDSNENILEKSFYSNRQKRDNKLFYNKVFSLGIKILSENKEMRSHQSLSRRDLIFPVI